MDQSTTDTSAVISANPNKNVEIKDFVYRFKKDKLGNQRPSIELKLPVPSFDGVVEILNHISENPKAFSLLQDAMYDVVRQAAGGIIADSESVTADNFPFDKVTWGAISNMEKADRRSTTISDETWESFGKDYASVMMAVANKSEEAVNAALQVYQKKFAQVKTNKPVLQKLMGQLALYAEHTKSGDDYAEILELLTRRADNYLKADDVAELISAL